MEEQNVIKGVQIEPNIEYFAQVANIGIEGKVVGLKSGKLIMSKGREYDLRDVVALGYEATKKYNFATREIPIGSIRIFRKS